jgi:tetratricopeptide (TPR) repeat protein
VLNNLGLLQQSKGDLDQAEQNFQQALSINTDLHERRSMASNLSNLGSALEDRQRLAEARTRFEQALAIDKEVEDQAAIAADLAALGRLSEREHRLEEAAGYWDRAYRGYRAINKLAKAGDVLRRLIRVAQALGQDSLAVTYEAELKTLTAPPGKK